MGGQNPPADRGLRRIGPEFMLSRKVYSRSGLDGSGTRGASGTVIGGGLPVANR